MKLFKLYSDSQFLSCFQEALGTGMRGRVLSHNRPQYHCMPLVLEDLLSYFRSFRSEDFTEIWKLYDLYGPNGTNDADIVKQ